MSKRRGLGRGLDALLGEDQASTVTALDGASATPQSLPLAQLRAGKYQPRTHMDPEALAELAASIRAQGVIQPILVRPVGPDHYEIIAGERRFRAAQIAGLDEVPVQVRIVADETALAMALIENIQREDLNPLEEAQGVQRLIDEFSFTHEQAAQAIGRSRSATSNLLRLLNLAPPVQQLLLTGRLDMGHARALLALGAVPQVQLAERIAAEALSVRAAEQLVRRAADGADSAGKASRDPAEPLRRQAADRDLARLEEELSDLLATGALVGFTAGSTAELVDNITYVNGSGQVLIRYATLDQLDGILRRLRGA